MALHITSSSKLYKVKVLSRYTLKALILQEIERQGPDADLNFIDTSEMRDMCYLFENIQIRNIKIEYWDVSNVKNMRYMFHDCRHFNSNISRWDVSNLEDAHQMFRNCSELNCDLSNWNLSKLRSKAGMFFGAHKLEPNNRPII